MSADTARPPTTPPNLSRSSKAAARKSHRSETPLPALDSLTLHDDLSDGDARSTQAQPNSSPDMAATAADAGDWQRSSSLPQSPDTVSPIYPDRLIRPLPKRKLRSRLSEGQAGSITYPPNVSGSSSVFGSPQSQTGQAHVFHYGDVDTTHQDDSVDETACRCADEASDADSEAEEANRNPGSWLPRNAKFHAHSSTSSADGYESFENTNNKKKRKIPVAGSGLAGGPGVLATAAEPGAGEPHPLMGDGSGESPSHSSLGPGFGISGAGRGRYGRQQMVGKGERRPLGPSHGGSNSTSSGNRMKRDWNAATARQSPEGDQGIISAAIASAEKKNLALNAKGQENMSLLQRPQATTGKDFTFECKSNSSNKMGLSPNSLPPSQLRPPPPLDAARSMATHGTQTLRHPQAQATPGAPSNLRRQPPSSAPSQPAPAPAPRPRRPRRPDQEYAAAARQRQMQQDLNNYHHPPRREDIWICEFCEYEAIWGKPPVQLVRDYEKKDRRERKAAEERRRLLEKAKAKSRKNRKGGAKGTGKHATAPPPPNQPYDEHYDNLPPQDQDSQGEEFFEDEYDDEGVPPGHLRYDDDGAYDEPYSPPLGPVHNGHAAAGVPAPGHGRH